MTHPNLDNFARDLLGGRRRGIRPAILRSALALVEPVYAGAATLRNRLYDRGLLTIHRLPGPVISVGNLTTGGTGKTPVVGWLAQRLIDRGVRPAVLMRGYRSGRTGGSDEQRMLEAQLNDAAPSGATPGVGRSETSDPNCSEPPLITHTQLPDQAIIIANPDRVAGSIEATRRIPPPDVFVLDDGFQHRRIARDFDLVLINAGQPFGFNHVLPRGLLREPLGGLRRADAVLITHADSASEAELASIEYQIRNANRTILLFRAAHAHAGLIDRHTRRPMQDLSGRPFFVFSGIGDPQSLARQFPSRRGERWFADHHAYSPADLVALQVGARDAGADVLVTTEKDWVKLAPLASESDIPIWWIELRIEFRGDDAARLLDAVFDRINPAPPDPPAGSPAPAPARSPAS